MKIGIFGDSFADVLTNSPRIGWVQMLSDEFDVENRSLAGSSTYYSYIEFLEHQKKYDKVIFVVTYPARIHTTVGPISSSSVAKFQMKNARINLQERRVLSSLQSYLEYALLDDEIFNQHVLFHNLMIEKIMSERLDILFVPAFKVPHTQFDRFGSLMDITLMENECWNRLGYSSDCNSVGWFPIDHRQHHMSEPNNRILYEKIKAMLPLINTHMTLQIHLSEFSQPDDPTRYITKK